MKKSIILFIGLLAIVVGIKGIENYKVNKKQKIKSIILLGKPGCGKGTQAKLWAEKYNLYHIDAGQLLRNCVKNNCKYTDEIKKAFNEGTMVRNEITGYVVMDQLKFKRGISAMLLYRKEEIIYQWRLKRYIHSE